MRIGLERIIIVIEKYRPRCTRKNDRVTPARAFERLVVAGLNSLDMVRIQRAQNGLVDVRFFAHAAIITGFRKWRESRESGVKVPNFGFNPLVN